MVYPAYQVILGHYRAKAFDRFKKDLETHLAKNEGFAAVVEHCTTVSVAEFDEGCADSFVEIADWDAIKVHDKLLRDIDVHVNTIQSEKLTELTTKYENTLEVALSEPVVALLDAATPDTWPSIKKLLVQETESATNDLAGDLSGFELDKKEEQRILENLQAAGRQMVEKKAREEANQALLRMKERFTSVFSHGPDSMPRMWTGKEDMKAIIRDARMSAIRLLSTLSALRLEEKKLDHIETALTSLVHDGSESGSQSGSVTERGLTATGGQSALASSTWEGVAASNTLITPVQCRGLWRQFNREIEYTVTQAITAQEASRRGASSLPPPWAIVAMVCLGFNEFMTLLRNPLYLVITFVLFLLGRAVWVQLDVEREFQHGYLTGIISVSAKLLPTFMNFLKRLAEEGQQMANSSGFSNNSTVSSGRSPHKHGPKQEMAYFTNSSDDSSVNGKDHSKYQ
ncbi:hypothetical protein L7F22_046153 [Adiantum nelumboides]|nr:hypothetical protein [Adiantum nelumboides]